MMELTGTDIFRPDGACKAVINQASIGILIVGQDGRIEMANQPAGKIFGYSISELTGQSLQVLIPAHLNPGNENNVETFLKNPRDPSTYKGKPLRAQKKDGTQALIEISLGSYSTNGNLFLLAYINDITEKEKEREERLRSKEKYRGLLENSLTAVIISDPHTFKILDANQVAADLYGYSSIEDFVSRYDTKNHYINPAEREVNRQRALKEDKVQDLTLAMKKLDGSPLFVKMFSRHIPAIKVRITVALDVTHEWKQFEELKKSEEQLRLLYGGIQEAFILAKTMTDETGKVIDYLFIEASPQIEKILGKPAAELIGHKRSDLFGTLDQEAIDTLNRVVQNREVIIQQRNIPDPDKWIEVHFYPSLDGQVATLILDITDRKKAEAKIEDEFQWLKFLNEASTRLWNITTLKDGLEEILSTSIKLMQVEKGNVQLLDQKKQSLIIVAHHGFGKEFLHHFREVSAESHSICGIAFFNRKQIVIEDVQAGEQFSGHAKIFKDENIRAVQSTPLFDHEGSPVGMISTHSHRPGYFTRESLKWIELYARYVESFLERMKHIETIEQINRGLEEKVKERTSELADALANEKEIHKMKSDFVTMASHEFRTPLTTILSSAELVEHYKEGHQQNMREKHLKRIKHSVHHMVDLLGDFLSLGKLEEGKIKAEKEHFNLEDTLREIVNEISMMKKKGQDIRFSYQGPKMVELDKKLVRNITINLISNAIKYSDNEIGLEAKVMNNTVTLVVKDNGMGIPADQQKFLFEKFFRAKNASSISGTGLGLTIVKHYVDLLAGTITFTSEENKGTTFTVTLPIYNTQH